MVKERLKLFLNTVNEKQSAFCAKIGVSQGYISGMRKSIQPDKINSIAINYPQLNIDWLLTGAGYMLKSKEVVDADMLESAPINEEKEDCRMVPVYNFDAVGGMDSSNIITDAPAFIEKYVPFQGAQSGDFCMRVSGNSMIPTYSPGSIVLVRKVEGWKEYFGYGHTFVLYLKDGRRILKEVQRCEKDPLQYVLCTSHNKDFPPEELPKSFIKQVYKVIITLNYEGF